MRQPSSSPRRTAQLLNRGALVSSCGGYSLIEILAVLSIFALMCYLVVPGLTSGSINLRAGTTQISEVLEQAYSSAISRNTYVWVGLSQAPTGGVAVAAVYSARANPGDFPSKVLPLTRPAFFPRLNLATITTQITNPNRVTTSVGQITDADDGSFPVTVGGSPQTLSYVIAITPSGQVSISSTNRYAWMEIGLASASGGKDVSVLQMNAFTGRISIYQP